MHEAHIVRNLVTKIEALSRREAGPKILAVKVRLGALTGMSAETLREHFRHAAQGTVAEGARLRVIVDEDASAPFAQEIVLESVEIEDIGKRSIGNGSPSGQGSR